MKIPTASANAASRGRSTRPSQERASSPHVSQGKVASNKAPNAIPAAAPKRRTPTSSYAAPVRKKAPAPPGKPQGLAAPTGAAPPGAPGAAAQYACCTGESLYVPPLPSPAGSTGSAPVSMPSALCSPASEGGTSQGGTSACSSRSDTPPPSEYALAQADATESDGGRMPVDGVLKWCSCLLGAAMEPAAAEPVLLAPPLPVRSAASSRTPSHDDPSYFAKLTNRTSSEVSSADVSFSEWHLSAPTAAAPAGGAAAPSPEASDASGWVAAAAPSASAMPTALVPSSQLAKSGFNLLTQGSAPPLLSSAPPLLS